MTYGKRMENNEVIEGLIHLTPEECKRLENGEELTRILGSAKGMFKLSVKITPKKV